MNTESAPLQATSNSSSGTAAWQPDAIAQHQAERSSYLEQMASTPIGQGVAVRTMELLDLAPGQAVLDVGCGNGVFLPTLARAVGPTGRVIGLDHAPAFVAEARARVAAAGLAATVTVEEGDVYRLPFPDDTFDAAHCERVLMHLADPTSALREMARVVRPGGWVVAAETDWAGCRIDHPDQEGFAPIYRRALTMAQPDMGLTLYRHFLAAGMPERRPAVVATFLTDVAAMRAIGLDLETAADALVAEGNLTREQATELLTYLEEASRAGSCYSCGAIHVVAGRSPHPTSSPDGHPVR